MSTTTTTRSFLGFCCVLFCFTTQLSAQNLALSTTNPAGFYVCGVEQMSITIQNNTGSPTATNLKLSVVFPTGITYESSTISGATEFNVTNLNAPVFTVSDLPGGSSATLTLNVKAGCALVDAINSGQQFSNNITATYTGGSKQLTSNTYIVETGLANLISVSPPTVNAMKGDVIMRTIKLKNTRQGPIESLSFRDQHANGISIELVGAINQNDAPTLFKADVPGSFFSAFGDGDNLLEESDGEITLVEKITVTDCGVPSFTCNSDIIVGWGCGPSTCRSDSISAQVTILPSNQNPSLTFTANYARPLSNCGQVPSVQEILINNTGQLPAENILVDVFTLDTSYMAFDPTSFEWSDDNGATWHADSIITSVPTVLGTCSISQYKLDVVALVPHVAAGSQVRLRFHSYFCQPACYGLIPRMRFAFSYNKACPANVATNGIQNIYPDTAFLKVSSMINYDIGHCLQDDSTYTLIYWTKSKRFLVDTGVLLVTIQLPNGFEWDPTCGLNLDGQTPLSFSTMIDANGTTTVKAAFDLPFTQDSVGDEICIKYKCKPDLPCQASVPNVPPRGLDFTVYPPESDCHGCELAIHTFSTIALSIDDTAECGITACDAFTIVVDDVCNGGGPGGGGGLGDGGGTALEITVDFDSWRVNRGLQDDNNDRKADSNNKANAPGIRLDRFITGDTLRNELKIAVLAGNLIGVNYRLFLESLMSDFDSLGADAYDIKLGKKLFANYDTTEFTVGQIIFKKAGGQILSCPIDAPTVRSDQHLIQVAEPNIRPPVIRDQLVSMFDQYTFSVDDYIARGCLPQGFTLAAGDSVFFRMDYKFTSNFTPPGGAMPPLINFRTSVCDVSKNYSWNLGDFCTVKPIRQYSGFSEIKTPAAQRIEPCDVSTETSPFRYAIRIARENMFPFEVRPLSSVFGYSYSLPTNVNLLATKLTYLTLQESVPVFSNQTLTPTYGGDSIHLNLDPYFSNPLDEGYSFEISTQFDTTCGYDGTKFGRTNLSVQYANECLHNPASVNYFIPNPNGYQNGSPQLDFFNVGSNVLFIPTNNVQLNFTIRNSSPVVALHPWIIIDSDNNLSDVQLFLIDPPNLIPVPIVGGVYQLDSLSPSAQPFFRVIAKSNSCRSFVVHYRFGWGCSPTYNDQSNVCGEFSGSIEIRPQPPELELIIVKEQTSIPFCAPSADFEFEIANANDGSAYNVVPSVKLPPGIQIVAGSSRLSFPAGSATVVMPDPIQLPGNVWQFNPEAVSPLLVQNGLVSFEQEPLNAMRILFKVRAECGSVANAQPVYGAEAVQPCGISSNVLRKPGQPLGINGVNGGNQTHPSLEAVGPISCGQTVVLSATIGLDGAPMAGDSIYITLPAGTSYVTGSYNAGTNAPAGPPKVNGQNLQLPLPASLGSQSVVTFTFSIRYDNPAGCADKIVTLQTREKTQAVCGNTPCDVYVSTGEYLLNLNVQNPELQLNNFQLQTLANGQTTFTANLENAGTATATNPVVQLYQDQNGNGQIDPSDPLIATVNTNGTITPGALLGISGNLTLPTSAYCDLIALIPAAENCACSDHIFPLGGKIVVTKGLGFCLVQPVTVGTELVPGNTYVWQTTDGLSCTTCNTATYTPGPNVPPGALVTLVLLETSGDCVIERRFDIQFGGSVGIETTDQTICQGHSATLQAAAGGTLYNWVGPGITNPNQQTQIVTPMATSLYSVTVTFAGGSSGTCTGSGSVTVFVVPTRNISSTKKTCTGHPIDVFDNLNTDVPGVYTRTLTGPNGCDSILTVTLQVPDNQTEETITICQGDSVVVYGQTFKTNGMKCENTTSSAGCDSTHCITVKVVPNPNIPAQDSVIVQAGTEVTLDGPSGFASYNWTPPGALSCSDCENPIATPDSTTVFILAVKDGNGCRDTVGYRVVTCDVDKYLNDIPNAFTPNGDGANDIFRPVPGEGAEMVVLLQIYNRWGAKLYEGRGPGAGWNGLIGDTPASSDVYVYILVAECSGIQKRKSGEVTLIR